MARLSIVIPHWGTISQLEDTLVSVLENRPDDCQVIVVLRDFYGDPYELRDEVSFLCAPIGAEPVQCVNLGVDAAEAPVVHVLAPGVEVTPGWTETALRHFDDPSVVAVAPRVVARAASDSTAVAVEYLTRGAVRAVKPEMLLQAPRGETSRLGPDARAGFYRRATLQSLGRFGVELGWPLAAVDFALALGPLGYQCVFEGLSRVCAGRDEEVADSPFRQALRAERLFWRWLSRPGTFGTLVAHLGEVILATSRQGPGFGLLAAAAGRAAGLLTAPAARRRRPGRLNGHSPAPQRTPSPPHFASEPVADEASAVACCARSDQAPS